MRLGFIWRVTNQVYIAAVFSHQHLAKKSVVRKDSKFHADKLTLFQPRLFHTQFLVTCTRSVASDRYSRHYQSWSQPFSFSKDHVTICILISYYFKKLNLQKCNIKCSYFCGSKFSIQKFSHFQLLIWLRKILNFTSSY